MAETFIQKLMSDEEGRKLYFREDLIFEVTEAISQTMAEKGVNKAELSRLAGVSKSNITQLLSGDQNMRLTTVADLLYALDSKLAVSAVPLDIDRILEGTNFDQWAPAVDLTIEEFECIEVNEDVKRELSQAA
jgi:transcriptional regulator with XRE-family HTH domain